MEFLGGIWVLWNPHNITVELIATAFHEIHFKIHVNFTILILTAIYANPTFNIRKLLWEKLARLASFINLPWLLMGDFNDISLPCEKFGGCSLNRMKMRTFNSFLDKANLLELGFIGPKFTWTNCRHNGSLVRTRINRHYQNIAY